MRNTLKNLLIGSSCFIAGAATGFIYTYFNDNTIASRQNLYIEELRNLEAAQDNFPNRQASRNNSSLKQYEQEDIEIINLPVNFFDDPTNLEQIKANPALLKIYNELNARKKEKDL